MKNQLIKPFIAGAAIALLASLLTGCDSCKPGRPGKPGQYNLEVALDSSLQTSSVIVDLVGINPSDLPRWEAYDMGKYWHDGDPMRQDADKVVLDFVSGKASTQTFAATDPHWEKWKSQGVRYVLVLADLPGQQTSRPGNEDARRQILPLDKCSWVSGTKGLSVLVQRSGIKVLTPSRPLQ
jgi:hypothetical protein